MKQRARKTFLVVCGATATVLFAAALTLAVSQMANATPQYAQQTGKACGYCHVNAAGGGALKPAGKKFQSNGHKL